MSIAGGLPRAVARARLHGCESLQVFTRSTGQWRARPIPDDEATAFRADRAQSGIGPALAHAHYLINVASGEPLLRGRSLASLAEELDRAELLGLLGVVLHPGAGPEIDGLQRIADALLEVLASRPAHRTMVLLEQTAGQGSSLGWRFDQIAKILELTGQTPRIGVCLDTCHLFAAGYDISTEGGYHRTFEDFDRIVGLNRLHVFHLNDSKRPLGSRVDRHEHIGHGYIGIEAFRRLLNDPRFAGMPMLIETEKSRRREGAQIALDPLDEMNLRTLRGMLKD
ncbi:MAG: deoxyribonuclease IV [Acidobacteria bacterium]|nr:MAG: deoxyribonuclease IV [Acidobacteriota bacterium]